MSKKKIIIIISAVAAAALILCLVLCFGGKNDDIFKDLPFTVKTEKNSAVVKFSGSDDWQAVANEDNAYETEETKDNTFVVTCDADYAVGISFFCTKEDGAICVAVVVADFSGEKTEIIDAYLKKQYKEQSFCDDTELPVNTVPNIDGSVDVVFLKNTEGAWETLTDENRTADFISRDENEVHFTVSSAKKGEFTVEFRNVTVGLSSTVTFNADEDLLVYATSASVGECEKNNKTGKEEEKAEAEKDLVLVKENFTDVNFPEDEKIVDAYFDENGKGINGSINAKYNESGYALEMQNYGLESGFGYDYSEYEKTEKYIRGISVTFYSQTSSVIAEYTSGKVMYRLTADDISVEDVQSIISELMG